MSEQTPSNQPTAPGDPASGVQGGDEAVSSKHPASNLTAEERIRKLQFYAEWSANGHGGDVVHFDDAIHVAEEHAAAAVKELKARVAELERERDEARARVAELERIPHDAPTIVEVEEYVYAPGWLDRVRAALGKEAQP